MTVSAVSCGCPTTPINCTPTWKVTTLNVGNATTFGTATVLLDNGYRLEMSEGGSQIKIINSCANETTTIWGDPHVDWNGVAGDEGRFFGTATFVLSDGTKITVNTVPYNNGNEWLANNVVVTKGDQSLIIDGLAQTTKGDFKVYQGLNGKQLDALVGDGKLTVFENSNGIGWVTSQGGCVMATQTDFNKTKVCADDVKAPDLCKQLETMYHCGTSKPGSSSHAGGGVHCATWFEILAGAWGTTLDDQAEKLEDLAHKLQNCSDADRPSYAAQLTAAAAQFQIFSTQAMTHINSIGQGLQTISRAG